MSAARPSDSPPALLSFVERSGVAIALRAITLGSYVLGLVAIGAGAIHWGSSIDPEEISRSAAATSLLDLGSSLREDVARVVRPAMERTQILSVDPRVAEALRSAHPGTATEICNEAIRKSTEVDAIALFGRSGEILAINTVYTSGESIERGRIERILGRSFAGRPIISECLRADSDKEVLEFQTACDITPALFDSSGLSIAYSVPVHDPRSGERLGVVSSRIRFERLRDLFRSRVLAEEGRLDLEFVTDLGGYFSEEIAIGLAEAPIASEGLEQIVAPLVQGKSDHTLTRYGERFVSLFRLNELETLEGGGIQVLLVADGAWLTGELRRQRMLEGGAIVGGGTILLLLVALLHALAVMRKNLREQLDSERRTRMIVDTALDALVMIERDGTVTEWNPQACVIFGFSRDEAIGRKIHDLIVPAELRDRHVGGLSRFSSGADSAVVGRRVEFPAVRKDGSRFTVELSVTPIRSGPRVVYSAFLRDITVRRETEQHLQRLVQVQEEMGRVAGVGGWEFEPASGRVTWTRGMYEIFEAPRSHAPELASSLASFPGEGSRIVLDLVRRATETLEGFDYTLPFVTAKGRARWVHGMGKAERLPDGSVRLYGALADVTDAQMKNLELTSARDEAEAALRETEALRHTLYEHGIVTVADARGMFVDVNDTFCRISGYSREELIGRDRRLLESGEHSEPFWARVDWTTQAGEAWHGELCYRAKDGSRFWLDSIIAPFRGPGGGIEKVVSFHNDITERKHSERLQRERDAAEAANRAKSEFLAHMSHEIRTPLNGVIGMIDLLIGTELTEQQRKFAQLVKTSASALTAIITDILDLSKIEAGKQELLSVSFEFRPAVEDSVEMLAGIAHGKGLEIALHIENSVPPAVIGDPDRLRQVLVNLVGNAIKFTDRGAITVEVRTQEISEDAVTVAFSVRDTGIGVPAEQMDRLFRPFSQVDSSTRRRYGGTGLGLAISRQLVELMSGSIGAESVAGQGSHFWIMVRFALDSTMALVEPIGGIERSSVQVLAVVGEERIRELTRRQLTSCGFVAATASTGTEALRLLAERSGSSSFDVVVIDSEIPGMRGATLARAIRASVSGPGPALVLLAAPGSPVEPDELRSIGLVPQITKPVRQAQLREAILRATEGSRVLRRPEPSGKCTEKPECAGETERVGRVLLAEDNEINQIVATEILANAGYACDVVEDGRQAVEAVFTGRYDLVLMDCQMPEMDGFEATRAIRERESRGEASGEASGEVRGRIPIIALTANAVHGDREHCLAAGMDAYLSKPVDSSKLIAALELWLRREVNAQE